MGNRLNLEYARSHKGMTRVLCAIRNRLSGNKGFRSGVASIAADSTLLKKCVLNGMGQGNIISIGELSRLTGCTFYVRGNDNVIQIGRHCKLKDVTFWIEGDGNALTIGEQTTAEGSTEIACIEGCTVEVGADCMLSSGITVRTGDSHSIVDANGERINPSEDVKLADHVWVGAGATILKGVRISSNSIVGAQAVVTKRFHQSGTCLAGNPAKVVKTDVSWLRERIPSLRTDQNG